MSCCYLFLGNQTTFGGAPIPYCARTNSCTTEETLVSKWCRISSIHSRFPLNQQGNTTNILKQMEVKVEFLGGNLTRQAQLAARRVLVLSVVQWHPFSFSPFLFSVAAIPLKIRSKPQKELVPILFFSSRVTEQLRGSLDTL